MTDATMQTTWFAQPEQGGSWLAQNEGLYPARNVNGKIQVGGPGIDTVKLLAAGQVKFAYAHADQLALARNEGIPVVGVMAGMEKSPQAIMVHESSGITNFEDIAKRATRVYVANTSAVNFTYLRKVYGWQEDQFLRYTGQLGDWLTNTDRAVASFVTNEPFVARKAGVTPRVLSIPDLAGFNPYTNVLMTTEETIQKEPELVYAVVAATLEGWNKFLESPDKTLAYIKSQNPNLADDSMKFTFDTMKSQTMLVGDARERGVGVMTKARWDTLFKQLKEIGVLKPDLDPDKAWTDEFFKEALRPFGR